MRRRAFLAVSAGVLARGCGAEREAVLLVTADTEAHVAVVTPRTGRVRARIRTVEGPRSIEATPDGQAVVAHTKSGRVTLLRDRRVRRVLRAFTEPRYAAAKPGWAFVTDSARGTVTAIDLWRGRIGGAAEVGDLARHLTIAPDGRTLWVSLGNTAAEILSVDVSDPSRPRRGATLRPPFPAHDVGCSPDASRLWVTSGSERRLAIYAPGRPEPLAVLDADAPPQHVTFAGARAFVTSGDDGSLRVQRADDGRRLAAIETPIGSYNVQRGGGWVVTPSLESGAIVVADLRGRVVARAQVAAAAHDACFV